MLKLTNHMCFLCHVICVVFSSCLCLYFSGWSYQVTLVMNSSFDGLYKSSFTANYLPGYSKQFKAHMFLLDIYMYEIISGNFNCFPYKDLLFANRNVSANLVTFYCFLWFFFSFFFFIYIPFPAIVEPI